MLMLNQILGVQGPEMKYVSEHPLVFWNFYLPDSLVLSHVCFPGSDTCSSLKPSKQSWGRCLCTSSPSEYRNGAQLGRVKVSQAFATLGVSPSLGASASPKSLIGLQDFSPYPRTPGPEFAF